MSVQLSAEVRWFWQGAPPDGLQAWFEEGKAHGGLNAGGGKAREDVYVRDPGAVDLGIKARGAKPGLEVKSLVGGSGPPLWFAGLSGGPAQLWVKATTTAIPLPEARVTTTKVRRLRKLSLDGTAPVEVPLGADEQHLLGRGLPHAGCNVELTRVTVGDGTWWTLGFESFGDLPTIADHLQVALRVFHDRAPPAVSGGAALSYPAWLASLDGG